MHIHGYGPRLKISSFRSLGDKIVETMKPGWKPKPNKTILILSNLTNTSNFTFSFILKANDKLCSSFVFRFEKLWFLTCLDFETYNPIQFKNNSSAMLSQSSRIPNQLTNLCSKPDVLNVSKDCWCIHRYPSIYREHRPPATISLAWSVPPQGRHPWNSWPKGFVSSFRNPKGWMDRKMRQMFWAIHDSWLDLSGLKTMPSKWSSCL